MKRDSLLFQFFKDLPKTITGRIGPSISPILPGRAVAEEWVAREWAVAELAALRNNAIALSVLASHATLSSIVVNQGHFAIPKTAV